MLILLNWTRKRINPSSKESLYQIIYLVFTTAEIQAELAHQFQQANTGQVRTIHQEKWLAHYNELIKYKKLNTSAAFMCGGKLGRWVKTQQRHYKSFKEGKYYYYDSRNN